MNFGSSFSFVHTTFLIVIEKITAFLVQLQQEDDKNIVIFNISTKNWSD